ncbi:MAG TPA: hypothetical protein PKK26_06945 [Candidatus Wallbacteria bacterium]|nr:hypothetical protein [Candidatus Wallbacteria bacterium]
MKKNFEFKIKKGFIEVMVVLILAVSLAVGSIYFKYSTQAFDNTIIQAHRIKARNLASAAYQKALLTIKRQYALGNSSWYYPEQKVLPVDQFEKSLGDGNYKLLRVEIVKTLKTPYETINRAYHGSKYIVGNADYGTYDVYRIVTAGEVPSSGTRVKMTSMVKVIREKVRY